MCGCNRALLHNYMNRGIRPAAVAVAPTIPTVDTSVWGAHTWVALHIASVFSPSLTAWKELLVALESDIPCPDCRAHFVRWIRNHPFRANSMLPIKRMMGQRTIQPKIIPWLLNLHNDVNARTGKSLWNEQQIVERYGGDRGVRLAEGRESLEKVRGILGGRSFDLLMQLLR